MGLSPEQQGQIEDAAGQAEDKYKQAGHAAADQAEQGADAATAQVKTELTMLANSYFESGVPSCPMNKD